MSKNTTLSEQFRNNVEKYHTVRTVQKLYRKIPHCQNSSEIMSKNITLSEQFRNDVEYTTVSEHFRNHVEKYHTVRTVPKSCRKIPHCRNSSEIMYKNTTLSEQFRNYVEKYQTVRTVPKSCTQTCRVPKSCKKIPHFQNSSEIM